MLEVKDWLKNLNERLIDFEFALIEAEIWFYENEIFSERLKTVCNIMVLVWTAHRRGETISKQEVFDILNLGENLDKEELIYSLREDFHNLDFIIRVSEKNTRLKIVYMNR